MEILIGIVIIFFVGRYFLNKENDSDGNNYNITPKTKNYNITPKTKAGYRPTNRGSNSNVSWKEQSINAGGINIKELDGLQDAFTGLSLDPLKGLYQCVKCKVFYHQESIDVIKSENRGECVSCQSRTINFIERTDVTSGINFTPNSITLSNYKNFAGQVITFEGHVPQILESRRGSDYAVMFEEKKWTKGFKLVFFQGNVEKDYIFSLKNKKIKVRGLLVNHETFGWEIMVNHKSMILEIN